MGSVCDVCQHDPANVSKPHRTHLFTCDHCGMTFCDNCLIDKAEEIGILSVSDALHLTETGLAACSAWLWHCDETDEDLCPECFEREE